MVCNTDRQGNGGEETRLRVNKEGRQAGRQAGRKEAWKESRKEGRLERRKAGWKQTNT